MRLINTNIGYGRSLRGLGRGSLGDLIPCSQQPAGVVQNPGVNCTADSWYSWFLTPTGMLVTGVALVGVFYYRHHHK